VKNDDGGATKTATESEQGKIQSQSERSKLGRTWRVWAAGVATVAAVVFVIFAVVLYQKNIESQQQQEHRQQDEARIIQRESARKADEEKVRRDNEEQQHRTQQEAQQRRAKTQQGKPVPPEAPRLKNSDPRKVPDAQPAPVPDRGKTSDSAKESNHAEIPSTPVVKQEPVAKSPPIEAPVHPTASELLDKEEAALIRGDYSTALSGIKRFASAGDPRAQALLGSLYEKGLGVPHSAADAYMWYSLSVRAGNAAARDMKARVVGKLQPSEIRQFDRLVDKWRPNGDAGGSETR
jgi:hypothetical protein